MHKRLSEYDPGLAEDWIARNECERQRYGAVSETRKPCRAVAFAGPKNRSHTGMTKLHITLSLGYDARIGDALAQAEQMFEAANEAYETGNHQLALETYESILENHRHFESEFNAGNAAFKLGEFGKARVHYERAKLLDASNDNLQANIALLEAKIVDRITPVPNLGLGTWLSTWVGPGQLVGWVVWSLLWWTTAWALWALRWKRES